MSGASVEPGKVTRGRELSGDVELSVGAVVVGTGAGGSMALRELARAGIEAVALEEGGFHTPADFDQREEHMLPMLFQDLGGRTTDDLAIRVLQGRGVGGSTVHNTNLCKRIPDPILSHWKDTLGVSGVGPDDMRPAFETVERDLSVSLIPPAMRNANNEAMRVGVEKLGWRGAQLSHNRVGCQMSGFCELGCAYDAKQNALKVLVPQALAAGGRVIADVQARKILVEGGRAVGVEGAALSGSGEVVGRVRVRAKIVVLAGSAVGSAALALASGIPDPYEQLGRHLHIHPGGVVAGTFDREMDSVYGIPQSYECTELLDFAPGSDKRVWILTAFAHPIGTAATMPGFGAAHMRAMREYSRLAVLTAVVHDETEGQVTASGGGDEPVRPKIRYKMSEPDRAQMAKGLVASARILLAAGAREVVFPAIPPVRVRDAGELDRLDTSFVRPHSVPLSAVHPMSTMRMGGDPKTSVVGPDGEHHQVKGLFVSDGSLFPTSIGGPPQIGIYSLALHLSPHMVAAAKRTA